MDVSPARLWELCASSLWTTRQLQAGPHCRLSLEEFQVFFRKWLSTPDVRAKLARKLRRASMEEGAPAAAQQRQFSRLRGPADGELVEDDDGLEASIDEMIELPEGGVPFQYAFAMHSTPAGGRNERECTPEETLVVELLQSCERLEGEKAELSRKINELVIEQDTTERRVFEVELDKRGLATLLEQETASRRRAEETLATREKQWRGVETESLDDDELSSLLARLETAVSKVRATQSERLKSQREGLAKDLTCPITGEVVKDPVVAADGAHVFLASLLLLRVRLDRICRVAGHTYERAAIERWLQDHDTSPLTNAALDTKQLVPNLRLKAIVTAQQERAAAALGATTAAALPTPAKATTAAAAAPAATASARSQC